MNSRSPGSQLADTGRGNEAAILNAALAAFGAQGFNGASMREVAKGAGTSLSNLYNYFPSKSHLLAEVLRHVNAELEARLRRAVGEAGDDAASRLREAVRAYVGFVVDEQLAMLVSTAEVRYLRGEDRERLVAARDRTQSIFTEIVEQGAASGEFRTPYPLDAARAILTMISSVATWYRPDGRLSRGQLSEQHARYALALLEGPLPHR
ncbi:TetR/AcrR family transcriptional regulator [Pseudonocardia eucalypti]|uniref:TetR/AcrR family transcriptional regulator n=1 Tax=Pseudonocardia eucalypti TaxID=648755 RepID=A0ABP9QN42_9PSEU|nr:AcrR family transcriptional regulator [Pseudonocardia eucalypti]